MSYTIEETKTAKIKLETEITKLINEFQENYQVAVSDITAQSIKHQFTTIPMCAYVEIKVEI